MTMLMIKSWSYVLHIYFIDEILLIINRSGNIIFYLLKIVLIKLYTQTLFIGFMIFLFSII